MDYKQVEPSVGLIARLSQPWILIAFVISAVIVTLIIWRNTPHAVVEQEINTQEINLPTITLPSQSKSEQTNILTKQDWQVITVKPGDNLAKLLQAEGISAVTVEQIMTLGKKVQALRYLKPKEQLKILISNDDVLQELIYRINNHETLIVSRIENGYQAEVKSLALEPHQHYVMGEINHSLLQAGIKAGLNKAYIYQLINIFAWDIDFSRDIHPGDKFVVIYENYYADGKKVKDGPILAAEIMTKHKNYRAIRFKKANGDVDYYTPSGHSLRKAFLRAPLKYTRISSPFNLHRYHPILHVRRPHKGVDLAAPRGTPVRASSDGRIVLIGRDGGYGNAIKIQHNAEYETLYGHLSRFARHLKKGSHVKQGQIIGYVGSTGLANGPHLHYEFHVWGHPVNPMKVKLPRANPIDKQYRHKFLEKSKTMVAQLDLYQSAQLASSAKPSSDKQS